MRGDILEKYFNSLDNDHDNMLNYKDLADIFINARKNSNISI